MIIAPLVFATLAAGMSTMGDSRTVGAYRHAGAGLVHGRFADLADAGPADCQPHPARQFHVDSAARGGHRHAAQDRSALNLRDFITQVFPKSIVESMANNAILQILVFSLFFGMALGHLHNQRAARTLVATLDEVVHVMLKVTDYVMRFAPVGVFGAVAGAITTQGLGMLGVLASSCSASTWRWQRCGWCWCLRVMWCWAAMCFACSSWSARPC